MLLSEKELKELSKNTKLDLWDILCKIEDELCYENKEVSSTIDWLQNNMR